MSEKYNSAVVDALIPIFSSRDRTKTPLRSPIEPSSLTQYLGTTNRLRPLVPAGAPTGRANTRWTMFSGQSKSPLVMNRLVPVIVQVPSPLSVALVRAAPTSEPASGSVRTIVAPHLRWIIGTTKRARCAGVAISSRIAAKNGPEVKKNAAGLAPTNISDADHDTDGGAP